MLEKKTLFPILWHPSPSPLCYGCYFLLKNLLCHSILDGVVSGVKASLLMLETLNAWGKYFTLLLNETLGFHISRQESLEQLKARLL